MPPTKMQSASPLYISLSSNHPTFGTWQMLPSPTLTRTLCRSSPHISWHLLDLEHGAISDPDLHDLVAATASCGVSPVVRVAEGQHWMIKRALDSGAHGVVAPMIEGVEDARRVVGYAKYPPVGKRGFEPLLAVEKFVSPDGDGEGVRKGQEVSGMEYLEQANDSLILAVQIETKGALEDVEAIAAIDGIDVLFIGPFDLGVNIGHPIRDSNYYDKELKDAIHRICEAGTRAGKSVGIYCDTGEQARVYAERGFRMISVVTDMIGLRNVVRGEFETAARV